MRHIAVEEAEKRFRTLLGEVRGGAPVTLVDARVPVARLLPPAIRDTGRELAFLALKRHVSRCSAHNAPRIWTRSALYRGTGR